jgi:hypothetical protein
MPCAASFVAHSATISSSMHEHFMFVAVEISNFFVLNGHLNAIVIRKLAASIMSLAVRAAYHAHSIILRGSYCGGCSLKCAINWPLSVLKSVDVLHGHTLCFPIVDGRDGRRSAASGCLGRAFTSCSLAISSSICVALAC